MRDHALARVAESYRAVGALRSRYIRAKLRIDPIHCALVGRLPVEGSVVDLGCGAGQLTLVLALGAPTLELLGIDRDPAQIERGRQAADAADCANIRYLVSDIRSVPIPRCQALLVIDVLHSLSPSDQDDLLRRAARALELEGTLFVREVDRSAKPWWRYALVALEERLALWSGWAPSGGTSFRSADDLCEVLRSEGLEPTVEPMWGKTPYANVLISARRRKLDGPL